MHHPYLDNDTHRLQTQRPAVTDQQQEEAMLDRTKIWNDSYQSEALRSGRAGVHVMTVISASHNKAEAIAELQFRFSTDNGSASADAKLSAAEMRRLAALLTKHADRLEVLEAEAARLTQDANPTK